MFKKRRFIDTYVTRLKSAPDSTRPTIIIKKINDLIQSIGEDREAVELVQDMVNNCAAYVRAVVDLEVARMTGKTFMDPEGYRIRIEELDHTRTTIHNRLIDSVKIVNRICTGRGLAVFYKGNIDDRVQVADFAASLVQKIFTARKK